LNETCRFYDDLRPILGDHPNVTPWITNEDDDFDKDDDSLGEESEHSSQEPDEFPLNYDDDNISIQINDKDVDRSTSIGASNNNNFVDLTQGSKTRVSELSDSSDNILPSGLNTTNETSTSTSTAIKSKHKQHNTKMQKRNRSLHKVKQRVHNKAYCNRVRNKFIQTKKVQK
jgi:hypothetical protein